MLAVADGKPETMGLRKIIEYHVDFQFEITTRSTERFFPRNRRSGKYRRGLSKPAT